MDFKAVLTENKKGFDNERKGLFKTLKGFESEVKALSNHIKNAFDTRMEYNDIDLDKEVDDANAIITSIEDSIDNIRVTLHAMEEEYHD